MYRIVSRAPDIVWYRRRGISSARDIVSYRLISPDIVNYRRRWISHRRVSISLDPQGLLPYRILSYRRAEILSGIAPLPCNIVSYRIAVERYCEISLSSGIATLPRHIVSYRLARLLVSYRIVSSRRIVNPCLRGAEAGKTRTAQKVFHKVWEHVPLT